MVVATRFGVGAPNGVKSYGSDPPHRTVTTGVCLLRQIPGRTNVHRSTTSGYGKRATNSNVKRCGKTVSGTDNANEFHRTLDKWGVLVVVQQQHEHVQFCNCARKQYHRVS